MSKWPSLNTSRSISSLSDRAAASSLSSGRDTDEALEGHGGGVHQTYCCLHHRLPSRVRVGGEEVQERMCSRLTLEVQGDRYLMPSAEEDGPLSATMQ